MNNQWDSHPQPGADHPLPAGARVYTRSTLKFYDFFVHCFSNRLVWRCPARHLVDHCDKHLTHNHLEIGIGSGKLFRKSVKNRNFQRLVIADVNPDCLQVASRTLGHVQPTTWHLDLIDPVAALDKYQGFTSIGLNYVLHCLPVTMQEKLAICDRLIETCLCPGGVLFGSTLFPGQNGNWISRKLMKMYNRKQVFNNENDTPDLLRDWCCQREYKCDFVEIGCVGLFALQRKDLERG